MVNSRVELLHVDLWEVLVKVNGRVELVDLD